MHVLPALTQKRLATRARFETHRRNSTSTVIAERFGDDGRTADIGRHRFQANRAARLFAAAQLPGTQGWRQNGSAGMARPTAGVC